MGASKRRTLALVLSLTLLAVSPAICGGWASTPEARMACCATEAACPMHGSSSDAPVGQRAGGGPAGPSGKTMGSSGHRASHGDSTQRAADACCAASAGPSLQLAPGGTSAPAASAPARAAALQLTAPADPAPTAWRTPVSPPPLRRHLLISVFLL